MSEAWSLFFSERRRGKEKNRKKDKKAVDKGGMQMVI